MNILKNNQNLINDFAKPELLPEFCRKQKIQLMCMLNFMVEYKLTLTLKVLRIISSLSRWETNARTWPIEGEIEKLGNKQFRLQGEKLYSQKIAVVLCVYIYLKNI